MNKRYMLSALIMLSAMTCHMQSLSMTNDQRNCHKPMPNFRRPSQFKTGLFYGMLFPGLLIPSVRSNYFGHTKADKDHSFLKGFVTGLATSSTITILAGSYGVYHYFFKKQ